MCKLPVFRERLNQLLRESGGTIVSFAASLGISRQSLGYYLNGERIPDAQILKQIAEKCNVSADWLLGLPGAVKQPDTNLRAICEYTGLDEGAVNHLHTWKTEKKTETLPGGTVVLNGDHSPCFKALEILVNLPEGNRLLCDLLDYIQAKGDMIYTMQPGQDALVEGYAFFRTGDGTYSPFRPECDIENVLRTRLFDDVQRTKVRIQSDGLEG